MADWLPGRKAGREAEGVPGPAGFHLPGLGGSAKPLVPTVLLPQLCSEVSVLGGGGFPCVLGPQWVAMLHPSLREGLGLPGGAPAGCRGCACTAAVHQLGRLRNLLREPVTHPGGLPHEPQQLPELLDSDNGYVVTPHAAPPCARARPLRKTVASCPCRLASQGWWHRTLLESTSPPVPGCPVLSCWEDQR